MLSCTSSLTEISPDRTETYPRTYRDLPPAYQSHRLIHSLDPTIHSTYYAMGPGRDDIDASRVVLTF